MAGYLGSRPVIVQVDGYQREESESRYVNVSGDDFSGHLDFVDDAKARFGSSDELHIYTESSGSGHSYIQGDNIVIRSAAGTARLTVTSNDVDVSSGALKVGGTTVINSSRAVTATGLTVDGVADVNANNINYTGSSPKINIYENDITDLNTQLIQTGGDFLVRTLSDDASSTNVRIRVDHSTGDISFYEDQGSTAKFHWSAADERLGIGMSSPSAVLETFGGTSFIGAKFKGYTTGKTALVGSDNNSAWFGLDDGTYGLTNSISLYGTDDSIRFYTDGSQRAIIDSNGVLTINGGSAWNETNQGTGKGSIHLDPNNATSDTGGAITFGASDVGSGETAMAGIYTRSDSAYGTKMYLATTDSYANGPKTAVKIDQAGRVTTPRQPAFTAQPSSFVGSGGIAGTPTFIFATALLNIGGHFNTSNGRFTAPVDGNYFFSYAITAASSSKNARYLRVRLAKNGTTVLNPHSTVSDETGDADYNLVSASGLVAMQANDYVELNYGSAIDASGFVFYNDMNTFSGFLVS